MQNAAASLILFWVVASSSFEGVAAKPSSMFVFGDSYADTGNHDSSDPALKQPWQVPYGRSWPGDPTGRFSDGFVLTDFIAEFVNLPSPVPHRHINAATPAVIGSGVNFAYGGSGVFNTYSPEYTNISTQIDQFEQLMNDRNIDISSAMVLFVYGGNDYSVHIQRSGVRGIPLMITRVVNRINLELRRLYSLGFRTFAVTNLEPAGCLPFIISPRSMLNCSRTDNALSSVHNRLLSQSITTLKTFRARRSQFIILDQYKSFLSVLSSGSNLGFSSGVLESCCQATEKGAACGTVDTQGKPLYSVCPGTQKHFFWDGAHPTHAGWAAVSQNYRNLFD